MVENFEFIILSLCRVYTSTNQRPRSTSISCLYELKSLPGMSGILEGL